MRRVVLMFAIAACGAEAAKPAATSTAPATSVAPAAPGAVGLTPGEAMAFEVKIAGLTAGEAQLAVGALGDYQGHRSVIVKSRAATAGAAAIVRHIVDEATTIIDMDTGRPLAIDTLVEQGDTKTTARGTFREHTAEITYVRDGVVRPHVQRIDLGAHTVHDAHSAMADLRGWRAAPGAKRAVFVVGGRRLWRVDVTFVGEDTIGSALGNRRALRFTGDSYRIKRDLSVETAKPSRTFSVWLSDDADRVPLKVAARTELGEVVIELTEYNRAP